MNETSRYALIIEDHPLVAQGIAQYLRTVRPDVHMHIVANKSEGLNLLRRSGRPLVVIADIWLPEGSSLQAIAPWRVICPGLVWLAISGDDDPSIRAQARAAGAQGFVHKQAPAETLAAALHSVLEGKPWYEDSSAQQHLQRPNREWEVTAADLGLTPRQGEILALVLRGLPNKRIASALDITESTVKEHVTAILEKLGVRTRVEAITAMRGRRLVTPGTA